MITVRGSNQYHNAGDVDLLFRVDADQRLHVFS
jgi:hypothetical protein